jgi:hypothetical protein
MPYTRRISVADAADTGYPGYQAVFVASLESATVLAGFLGNGGHPPLHTHDVSRGVPGRQRQSERRAGAPSRDPDIRCIPRKSVSEAGRICR